MKNVNLINRDRFDAMLSQLAQECQTFFYLNGGHPAKNARTKKLVTLLTRLK